MTVGKDSSLSNPEIIKIEKGVSLQQFAPFKTHTFTTGFTENSEQEAQKAKNFEDMMRER